ncbi:MAG TPA: DUF4255 domain-containing protein [Pyrinomonadaceae bacterium]|nr:DUF4255 domain-containing protein [Pyrinomonadaceae bacterium]
MSSSTVIGDVTLTLQELLKDRQSPGSPFSVSVKSPADEIVEPMKPKINLFLFRVEESEFARNEDWEAVGTDGLHYPPLTLNLFYVMTPFIEDKLDEQRIFGEAMRVFYDNSIIDPAALKGTLENSAEELKVDLLRYSLDQLTQIWSALGKPYRLSVVYQIRMVRIDSLIESGTRRVLEQQFFMEQS